MIQVSCMRRLSQEKLRVETLGAKNRSASPRLTQDCRQCREYARLGVPCGLIAWSFSYTVLYMVQYRLQHFDSKGSRGNKCHLYVVYSLPGRNLVSNTSSQLVTKLPSTSSQHLRSDSALVCSTTSEQKPGEQKPVLALTGVVLLSS